MFDSVKDRMVNCLNACFPTDVSNNLLKDVNECEHTCINKDLPNNDTSSTMSYYEYRSCDQACTAKYDDECLATKSCEESYIGEMACAEVNDDCKTF